MSKMIKGKVVFQNLGTGFWGIEDSSGNQYRPVNMPEQLKSEGAKIKLRIQKVEEDASIFMWGTAVKIISFETLAS